METVEQFLSKLLNNVSFYLTPPYSSPPLKRGGEECEERCYSIPYLSCPRYIRMAG